MFRVENFDVVTGLNITRRNHTFAIFLEGKDNFGTIVSVSVRYPSD